MKRNSSTQDSDSDCDIWNYSTPKHFKQIKNKHLVSGVKLRKKYNVKRETAIDEKCDKINEQQIVADRCPACQVPFQTIDESLRMKHVHSCLGITITSNKECPDGETCKSDSVQHYKLYKHELLAKVLSGLPLGPDSKLCIEDSEADSCSISFLSNKDDDGTLAATVNMSDPSFVEKEIESEYLTAALISEFQTDFENADVTSTDLPSSCQTMRDGECQDKDKQNADFNKQPIISKQKRCLSASLPTNQRSILSFFAPRLPKQTSPITSTNKMNANSEMVQCTSGNNIQTHSKSVDNVVVSSAPAGALNSSGQFCDSKPARSIDVQSKGSPWFSASFLSAHSSGTQLNADKSASVTQSNEESETKIRNCPFYKRIPDTSFTVDAFGYGTIPGCTGYFLSHFHADHYYGLTRKFRHTLYCSQVTANLLMLKIKVDRSCVKPLSIGIPQMVEGVEVILLNANHCPGSVMFLFKLKRSGKEVIYLHTGDFRADRSLQLYPELQSVCIDQLFLDTTYCNPTYSFPPQKEVVEFAVNTTAEVIKSHPKTLVVVGTYTIGKERVFIALAESLRSKIYVKLEKKKLLDCLEDTALSKRLTLGRNDAQVHVVKMNQLTVTELTSYLDSFRPNFDHLLAFEPTGWTHSSKTLSVSNIRPKFCNSQLTIYGIPYSEHSSYEELKEFVQFLRPRKIIPTVNNGDAKSRQKMNELFHAWMSMPSSKGPVARQHALNNWIKK